MSSIHCLLGLPWWRNSSTLPSKTVSAKFPTLPLVTCMMLLLCYVKDNVLAELWIVGGLQFCTLQAPQLSITYNTCSGHYCCSGDILAITVLSYSACDAGLHLRLTGQYVQAACRPRLNVDVIYYTTRWKNLGHVSNFNAGRTIWGKLVKQFRLFVLVNWKILLWIVRYCASPRLNLMDSDIPLGSATDHMTVTLRH